MDLELMKKIAVDDVLHTGTENLDEKMEPFAEDVVVWDPVMKVGGFSGTNTVRGYEEVSKFFAWLGKLPPVKVDITNVFGEGEKVVVEWTLCGGEPKNEFYIPCANIYDFNNGKINGVRMHFDSAQFAEISSSS